LQKGPPQVATIPIVELKDGGILKSIMKEHGNQLENKNLKAGCTISQ
jgi:hypothetical protein